MPEQDLARAVIPGGNKVNVDTDLRLASAAEVSRAFIKQPRELDTSRYLGRGRDAVRELV